MAKNKYNKVVNFSQYTGYNGNRKPKKEKKKISFLPFVLVILAVIAICCICIFTDAFNIEKIEVNGVNIAYISKELDNLPELNDEIPEETTIPYFTQEGMAYYSIEDIILMSGITMGNNMFRENLDHAIKNIESAPYVKSANIIRKFPNTLIINVEERIFRFFVDYVGSYICVDEEGYIVNSITKSEKVTNEPIVVGIAPGDLIKGFVPGEMLNADDPTKLQRVINLLNLIDKNELELDVETIDVSNVNEVTINLRDKDISVNFGDMTNINLKIQFLPEILKDVDGKKGTILMNSNEDDFRPRFFEKI